MRYFILLFLFFSSHSFSEDYYWVFDGSPSGLPNWSAQRFVSPDAGCSWAFTNYSHSDYQINGTSYTVKPSGSRYQCTFPLKAKLGSALYTASYYLTRRGTSCPEGYVLDTSTNLCIPDPCKSKEGQTQSVLKSGMKNDTFLKVIFSPTLNKNIYFTQGRACFEGCQLEFTAGDGGAKCTFDIAGQYHCRAVGKYNGSTCTSDNPTSDPDPDGNDPVPQQRNSDEPCVYGTVNGVTGCQNIKKYDSDGIFGDTKGNSTCTAADGCNGVDPISKEDKIDTKITSTTNPDGSITTTKTDTKTSTNCKSNSTNCTTSTTTKTTTTTTSPNGTVIGSSGTCQGDQCPGNTNPDGDGDGFGDCTGDDCGDGDETKVSGESCDVPLTCEGDAIQCAILRQEKENNCKWRLGSEEQAAVTAEVTGENFELEEKTFDAAGLFNDAISQGRWLSSSCPAPRSISVGGRTITFSWEPICNFAIAMGPLIVAMASLFFAIYVFRGLKR